MRSSTCPARPWVRLSPTYGAYAASKAATDVLTRVLAVELRDRDITVNAVSLHVDRPCVPDRIAELIVHLLAVDGPRLTGQMIRVDEAFPGTT